MLDLTSAIEIDASPKAVWRILTDLPRFAEWNPFVFRAAGSTHQGGEVRVRVRSSLGIQLRFRAKVLVRKDEREIRWIGHVLSPWLASGEHVFAIEPLSAHRVRFVQRETFRGVVPWIAAALLERETRRGFDAMNRALKARAEQTAMGSAHA